MAKVYIVIEDGYDREAIAFVGVDWEAVRAFVGQYSTSGGLRVEEWDSAEDNTKPVWFMHATKVERFEVPEIEPGAGGEQ